MFNTDIAIYYCLRCGCRVGLSAIEPKHDCNNPFFNKDGSITKHFKNVYGNKDNYRDD